MECSQIPSDGQFLQLNEDVKSVKQLLVDVSHRQQEMERHIMQQLSSMNRQLELAVAGKNTSFTSSSAGRFRRKYDFPIQIPVHYPRYTKQEYETMPEFVLDGLLQSYGLPIGDRSLQKKKEMAIGTFIWNSPTITNENLEEKDAAEANLPLLTRLGSICKQLIVKQSSH